MICIIPTKKVKLRHRRRVVGSVNFFTPYCVEELGQMEAVHLMYAQTNFDGLRGRIEESVERVELARKVKMEERRLGNCGCHEEEDYLLEGLRNSLDLIKYFQSVQEIVWN